MKKAAVISADIIAYTGLTTRTKKRIEQEISILFDFLKNNYETYSRLIKGDYLEVYIPNPVNALRISLLLKSKLKTIKLTPSDLKEKRSLLFKKYAIRIAIGIGNIKRFVPEDGIIDGEAIYYAGRLLQNFSNTSEKNKIKLKKTLLIKGDFKNPYTIETIIAFIDFIINNATAKQSEILFLKLSGYGETQISKMLDLSQSTINQQSNAIGWENINNAITLFENYMDSNEI